MLVNADFSRLVIVTPEDYRWVTSPQSGVERVMLDRIGDEKARATSIVRYAPHSTFPSHFHPGGEEILVLHGTFSEGQTHSPCGYYLRNPPGSSHQPCSEEGAIIFVKLWQMKPYDKASVRIDTHDPSNWVRKGMREICPLFRSEHEQVCMLRLQPGEKLDSGPGCGELLVVAGHLQTVERSLAPGAWMRWPDRAGPLMHAGDQGVTVYLKTGHLSGVVGPM